MTVFYLCNHNHDKKQYNFFCPTEIMNRLDNATQGET